MTDTNAGEESFISHLVELRDRLVKACIGIAVVTALLFAWPGPEAIYNFLAAPMVDSLPRGSQMIATGIISPFLVPMKVTLAAALIMAFGDVFLGLTCIFAALVLLAVFMSTPPAAKPGAAGGGH